MKNSLDKKVAIVVIIFLFLTLASVFAFYQYKSNSSYKTENPIEESLEEKKSNNQNQNADQIQTPKIEIETTQEGGLEICLDQCGNGICQSDGCKDGNLNCVCQENSQECPQDCK